MEYVGKRVRRKEDLPLLTARGRYVADYAPAGSLHAAILRSPVAHAELRRIDTSAARGMPAVATVLTAADLPAELDPIPLRFTDHSDMERFLQYPLARNRIRYVGEPLAVVVANSRYDAEDALDRIKIEYDSLPVAYSVEAALTEDAPVLYPELGHNRATEFRQDRGDVDGAFAARRPGAHGHLHDEPSCGHPTGDPGTYR